MLSADDDGRTRSSGVAALYLQQNGKDSPPALVQAALQNYARPVSTTLNGTTSVPSSLDILDNVFFFSLNVKQRLETIAKQGAGLIDAYSSVHLKTRIVPSEIALNDTDHFVSSTVIKVSNFGTATAAYRLSHLPAGSLNVFGTSGAAVSQQPRTFSTASNTPLALNQAAATVSFSQTYITVAPGATEEVTVTFNAPSGSPAAQIPIYSVRHLAEVILLPPHVDNLLPFSYRVSSALRALRRTRSSRSHTPVWLHRTSFAETSIKREGIEKLTESSYSSMKNDYGEWEPY